MKFSDFKLDKTGDGLLPVIVQDSRTLKVLMLGYMNEEAYDRTLEIGKVTFWSRGRKCLWTKGETSGNYLTVVRMYPVLRVRFAIAERLPVLTLRTVKVS